MTERHRTVLVVEDEAFARIAAADAIQEDGAAVYEAADADEALSVLEEHPEVNLIFSDINMPGPMDGISLVHEAHKMNPEVAILVTSGARTVEDDELPDHGSFLPKPYSPQKLVSVIRQKLG